MVGMIATCLFSRHTAKASPPLKESKYVKGRRGWGRDGDIRYVLFVEEL